MHKISGESTDDDLMELGTLVKQDPELESYIQILTDVWKQEVKLNGIDTEKAFIRLQESLAKQKGDSL